MTQDPVPPYGTPDPSPRPAHNEQHIALLGGFRRSGPWAVPQRTSAFSLIGGVSLDLRDATFPPGEVVLLHASVVGGVDVTLPAHVNVRVEGLRLLGGQKVRQASGTATTTLVIRSFGVLGGVRVRR